LYWTAP